MATISQQPNQINSVYVPNVWTLDTLGSADRFVLQVVISGAVVATIKQPANPAGVAHFDVQKILQSYLAPSFVETTVEAADTEGAHLTYQVNYGTETSNAVTIDGTSAAKYVINAYDNWRVLNSDLSRFTPNPTDELCETNSNVNAIYAQPFDFLTNYPETEYLVRSDEYKTLSFLTRNINVGPNWGPNEAPFFVRFTNEAQDHVYVLSQANGTSLRTDCNDMTVNFTDDNQVVTIGVGPANIGSFFNVYTDYQVRVYSYNHCMTTSILDCEDIGEIISDGYLGDVIFEANFTVQDDCTPFDPITVSFMNQWGVKDYFTFDRRNTKTVTTQRNQYTKVQGSWSDASFTIDQQGRGDTVFSSYADTAMTLQSNWMSDAMSQWLQELYVSPSVMAYVDGAWEPVVITSNTYNEKTYARDRMFQHELNIQFANNKKIQRG